MPPADQWEQYAEQPGAPGAAGDKWDQYAEAPVRPAPTTSPITGTEWIAQHGLASSAPTAWGGLRNILTDIYGMGSDVAGAARSVAQGATQAPIPLLVRKGREAASALAAAPAAAQAYWQSPEGQAWRTDPISMGLSAMYQHPVQTGMAIATAGEAGAGLAPGGTWRELPGAGRGRAVRRLQALPEPPGTGLEAGTKLAERAAAAPEEARLRGVQTYEDIKKGPLGATFVPDQPEEPWQARYRQQYQQAQEASKRAAATREAPGAVPRTAPAPAAPAAPTPAVDLTAQIEDQGAKAAARARAFRANVPTEEVYRPMAGGRLEAPPPPARPAISESRYAAALREFEQQTAKPVRPTKPLPLSVYDTPEQRAFAGQMRQKVAGQQMGLPPAPPRPDLPYGARGPQFVDISQPGAAQKMQEVSDVLKQAYDPSKTTGQPLREVLEAKSQIGRRESGMAGPKLSTKELAQAHKAAEAKLIQAVRNEGGDPSPLIRAREQYASAKQAGRVTAGIRGQVPGSLVDTFSDPEKIAAIAKKVKVYEPGKAARVQSTSEWYNAMHKIAPKEVDGVMQHAEAQILDRAVNPKTKTIDGAALQKTLKAYENQGLHLPHHEEIADLAKTAVDKGYDKASTKLKTLGKLIAGTAVGGAAAKAFHAYTWITAP